MSDPDPQGPIYQLTAGDVNVKTTAPVQLATWILVSEGPTVRWSFLIFRLAMLTFAGFTLFFNITGTAAGIKVIGLAWGATVLALLINGYELVYLVLSVWRPHRKWL